jgi:predicted CopG family antitoxin
MSALLGASVESIRKWYLVELAPKVYIYAYAYTYDMTKVISLSDEAYKLLKKLKGENESFSDVIIRLVGASERKPLSDFSGKWIGDDIERVFRDIQLEREGVRSRES